jgi:hypothetical protein
MRTLTFVALFACAILAIASQARAGSPCCCAAPCAAPAQVMHVYRPYEVPPIYIVNQGPVYSGGWVYSQPQVVPPRAVERYPYVASDYPVEYLPLRHYRRAIRARY